MEHFPVIIINNTFKFSTDIALQYLFFFLLLFVFLLLAIRTLLLPLLASGAT